MKFKSSVSKWQSDDIINFVVTGGTFQRPDQHGWGTGVWELPRLQGGGREGTGGHDEVRT